jgi:type IV secretory pathway ATPase VirB11/archaellum biosynthesis ATPase/intein/homing endonuclease
MLFEKDAKLYSYEVRRESGESVAYVNYLGASILPSVARFPEVFSKVVDILMKSPNVSRVVLVQQRNYNYDVAEVGKLIEVANLYNFLLNQEKVLSPERLGGDVSKRHSFMNFFMNLLRSDPIAAYFKVKNSLSENNVDDSYSYLLKKILGLLEDMTIIREAREYLDSYVFGDRGIYDKLFIPDIIPNYAYARLVSQLPDHGKIVSQYEIGEGLDKSTVTILKQPKELKYFYHIMPPEYFLNEDYQMLLNLARNVLMEHQPKAEEFTDPGRTRQVFLNVAKDLLRELSTSKGIKISYKDLELLSRVLVRHTIGFGLLEILLQDKNLQDIVLNGPIALNPIFLRHSEFDECFSNIMLSQDDADSWAAKFRMISGRPLDEANPILDTDLSLEDVRARISVVQRPLSPSGLSYAIRRHRDYPWTLPLFIDNKMINSFASGLMSFMIDGARTMLIAGTRSSGKTSLLGSLMLEIKPKHRMIVIEDSVVGDSRLIVKENGEFRKTSIGKFIDEKINEKGFLDVDGREKELNLDKVEIFSVDEVGKVVLSKPSKFIRHKVNKDIYEIKTTSGRKIRVTQDHSLFTLDEKSIMKPIKSKNIVKNSFIAIPSKLSFDNFLESIDLLDYLKKFDKRFFVVGSCVEKYVLENRKDLFSLGFSKGYTKASIQNWISKKMLPIKIFEKVKDVVGKGSFMIRSSREYSKISSKFILDDVFLNFVGLWIADGCYDKNSVIVSVQEEENREVVRKIAERFNCSTKMHSDKFSLMINSVLLKEIMQQVFELKGNSYTKNLSSWVYNLSDEQVGALLKGFFSGDGCASDKEIVFSSCSKELIEDIRTLLSRFSIVLRTSDKIKKDNTFSCRIGSVNMIRSFEKNIGFLVNSKQERLEKLSSRISTHDTSDIIPLSLEVKEELNEILGKKFNNNDYINRGNNIGRVYLSKLLKVVPEGITNPIDPLRDIVSSDIFWDKVKSVERVSGEGYVYDISVPGNENFICNDVVAHNTLELPSNYFRKLGYDILSMKVRSSLQEKSNEISAEDGIRTSLRLGDSSLIVGEIRSNEAKALYEAMRVGALANVVAGTVHGSSPYSVFDRIVNDLNVPITSFKATDLVLVANPVKSADGLHSQKRVVQLAEVRKHWTKDPLVEKGFVDLLKYDVEKDELEASDDLINGNSEIIKNIASGVKGWAGNWDAVYDNIVLRGKVKQELVDIAKKLNRADLLEAKFNALANTIFHEVSDLVTREVGIPDSKKVFPEWKKRVLSEIKKF